MLNSPGMRATAVDLFCGAGGLTRGLMDAGVHVAAGYDTDEACRYAYESNNPGAKFHHKSVTRLTGESIAHHFPKGHARILVGCAPCQTFSKYTQGLDNDSDPKWTLLKDFGRLVRDLKPDIVSIENVPDLCRYEIFRHFLSILTKQGFHFVSEPEKWIVHCPDYGVPQYRDRLVIVASRLGPIELTPPTHHPSQYRTVSDYLQNLPPLAAGETYKRDPLHRSSKLSELNLRRIKASKPGGTWRDWPRHLRAPCHRAKTGNSYPSIYGRMEWGKPSPTITTEFFGFGSGRFGHPEQDRAISLREGALLQSFPKGYKFAGPGGEIQMKKIGAMIGNAVPVRLGLAIGRTIAKHLDEYAS